MLLLRLERGMVLGRHRHGGEIPALDLAGRRTLLETGEVLELYELPGNVDSWMAVGTSR